MPLLHYFENGRLCGFCAVAARMGPAAIVRWWPDAVALWPLGFRPSTGPAHLLVIPICSDAHVDDARSDPEVTGLVARRTAELAIERGFEDFNIIVNCGRVAGQTVHHLHFHLLERQVCDGRVMPWSEPGNHRDQCCLLAA